MNYKLGHALFELTKCQLYTFKVDDKFPYPLNILYFQEYPGDCYYLSVIKYQILQDSLKSFKNVKKFLIIFFFNIFYGRLVMLYSTTALECFKLHCAATKSQP